MGTPPATFSLIGDPLFVLTITTSLMGLWPFGGWTHLSRRALNSATLVLAPPHLLVASASNSIVEGELFYPEIFHMLTPLCTYQGGRDWYQSWGEEGRGRGHFRALPGFTHAPPQNLPPRGLVVEGPERDQPCFRLA